MKTLVFIIFLCLSSVTAIAQESQKVDSDPFKVLEESQRPAIATRLSMFIDFVVRKDWPKVWSLLTVTERTRWKSEAELSKSFRLNFKRFEAKDILILDVTNPPKNLIVFGCAEYKIDWKNKKEAYLEAAWENDDWHFGLPSISVGIDSDARDCKFTK